MTIAAPLPADEARCAGDDDRAECIDCLRRTDRSTFPLPNWIGAPEETPCPERIACS